MRRLKRSECVVLPLVLKKRWFDLVATGQKKEEYRDFTEYWHVRLRNLLDRSYAGGVPPVVEFRLGYAAHARRTAFLVDGVHFRALYRFEHPDWGEPCRMHYVVRLGERVVLEGGE